MHLPHARHGPSQPVLSVHYGSIHFVMAIVGKYSPASGIEQRAVFEAAYGGFYGIESRATVAQQIVADG